MIPTNIASLAKALFIEDRKCPESMWHAASDDDRNIYIDKAYRVARTLIRDDFRIEVISS